MKRPLFVLAVSTTFAMAVGGLAAVYAYSAGAKADTSFLAWRDPVKVNNGRLLYAEQCAGCHGASGQGQTARADGVAASTPLAPAHDASGHTWQHPDFALFQVTKTGVSTVACRELADGAMPKFAESLTDAEIIDVLSYLKSTWPAETRAEHDRVNEMYSSHNAIMREMLGLDG